MSSIFSSVEGKKEQGWVFISLSLSEGEDILGVSTSIIFLTLSDLVHKYLVISWSHGPRLVKKTISGLKTI